MKKTMTPAQILKEESGIITLDFIFALSLSFGFAIIFFAMSFTLSMVEMSQYITFAAARAYNGANVSEEAQQDLARKKYAELRASPMIKTILATKWITLGDVQLGDFGEDGYDTSSPDLSVYVGARIPFKANVLNMRIPILGNTVDDSSTGSATLNAYLMREVSTQECRENFTAARYEKLRQLDSHYQALPNVAAALVTDNGC